MGYGIPNFQTALDNLLNTVFYEEQTVKVYPNPVSELLHIQKNNLDYLDLKIYNLLGKLVFEAEKVSEEINLSSLSSGVYIAKFETENFQKSLKIIKK